MIHAVRRNAYDSHPLPKSVDGLPELVLCPRELDCRHPIRRRYPRHVEPSVLRTRHRIRFSWKRLQASEKLTYCSFGTQSPAYEGATAVLRRIVVCFRQLNQFQLVTGICSHQAAEQFQNPPGNAVIATSVPQLEILSYASLVITHGGFRYCQGGDVYPRALHQRCWVHKMRNILEKVRKCDHDQVKADAQAIYQAEDRSQAQAASRVFRSRWQKHYGSMVRQ